MNFDFYTENNTLISGELCSRSNFPTQNKDFFWPIKSVIFFENIFYSQQVCPYVFLISQLKQIVFLKIVNSLIYKNQLGFVGTNETQSKSLKIKDLERLEFNVIFEDVTLRIMNKYLFERVMFLSLTGSIGQIQEDIFEHFKYLNILSIRTENIGGLYENGLEWLRYLNKDMRIDFARGFSTYDSLLVKLVKFQEICSPLFSTIYSYPDSDFCLFRDFPHSQLVLPMILNSEEVDETIECTCTIL